MLRLYTPHGRVVAGCRVSVGLLHGTKLTWARVRLRCDRADRLDFFCLTHVGIQQSECLSFAPEHIVPLGLLRVFGTGGPRAAVRYLSSCVTA